MSPERRLFERYAERLAGWASDEEARAIDREVAAVEHDDRETLDLLRELAEIHRRGDAGSLTEHVHPQHLVTFSEEPDSLPPALASWIREHVEVCEECRDDLEVLRRVDRDADRRPLPVAADTRSDRGPKRRTAGRPARRGLELAAVAALGAAAGIALGIVLGPRPAPLQMAQDVRPVTEITVGAPHSFRAPEDAPGAAPEPILVPRPANTGGVVVLRLDTGLSPARLSARGGPFTLELVSGSRRFSLRRTAEHFGPYGHTSVTLPADLTMADEVLEIRLLASGSEPLFAQRVLFVDPGEDD
jgi:hypothetical protein